ncbi:MAG: alpha/beta family hydrolase [Acidobacteriaceae bacterium]
MPHSHTSGSAVLRTIDDLHSPAGRLEALLNAGAPDAPYSALVCHPHPLGGGTMHNKVVYTAMKALQSLGLPVLRFNFRGTELSEGEHDEGRGEQDDVRAALAWLEREFHRPILFAGFSFGAYVGLRACCGDPRVPALIALGLPVRAEGRDYSYDFLRTCSQPKLFISGVRDPYGPRAEVEAAVALASDPKELVWIDDADHFFLSRAAAPAQGAKPAGSKLVDVQRAIRSWAVKCFPLLRQQ